MQQQFNQTMTSPNAMLMQQPPQVITSKDLSYLEDQLSWQLNSTKKCAHYAQECTDPQVKQAIQKAGQMHQKHYQMLLKHCQHNNSQIMNSLPKQTQ